MPFREPFNGYYEQIIKPVVIELGMQPLRGDEVYGPRAIIRDVWDSIWRAAVIIADVTDRNPNVNYELGLCHALGVPTVLLTKKIDDVPFDYRHRRYIHYDTEHAGWEAKLRRELMSNVRAARAATTEEELPWPYDTAAVPGSIVAPSVDLADPRAVVVQGVRRVRETIARAIGPLGGSIAASTPGAMPLRRGVAIVEVTRGTNPLEERGIGEMQEVAREQMSAVGDGTKTALLLASTLIEGGDRLLRAGHARARVLATFRDSIPAATAAIDSMTKEASRDDLSAVAVSAGGDGEGARLAAEAVGRFGVESFISVESTEDVATTLNVWEGMRVDAGYAHAYFVTRAETMTATLENPFVLVTNHAVTAMRDLLPILEAVAQARQPLLLFGAPVEGEALASLVANKVRETISCVAVNLPARGRDELMTDIAAYCGGSVVRRELGMVLENLRIEDLGRAERVVVDRASTRIIGGRADAKALSAHLQSLRTEMASDRDPEFRRMLRQRLLRLEANVAVISVGGRTRVEVEEARSRAEAALASCIAAAAEGVVPGGGVSLFAAADAVRALPAADDTTMAARAVVIEALETSIRSIIDTASGDSSILDALRRERPRVIFDALHGAVRPLAEAPVLDAAQSLRRAIEIAHAHAARVLETISWDVALAP